MPSGRMDSTGPSTRPPCSTITTCTGSRRRCARMRSTTSKRCGSAAAYRSRPGECLTRRQTLSALVRAPRPRHRAAGRHQGRRHIRADPDRADGERLRGPLHRPRLEYRGRARGRPAARRGRSQPPILSNISADRPISTRSRVGGWTSRRRRHDRHSRTSRASASRSTAMRYASHAQRRRCASADMMVRLTADD